MSRRAIGSCVASTHHAAQSHTRQLQEARVAWRAAAKAAAFLSWAAQLCTGAKTAAPPHQHQV